MKDATDGHRAVQPNTPSLGRRQRGGNRLWRLPIIVLVLALAAAGCGGTPAAAPPEAVVTDTDRDVVYLLNKLENGSREERGDALAMLVADAALYPAAEPHLRRLAVQENDLFLRERLIDGLGVMATERLFGAAQVGEFGIPRQAAEIGHTIPAAAPTDDLTARVLERLVHDENPHVVAHARAARARIGIRRGLWGLIVALEARDTYPEMADLSLHLLREITGLHLTGGAADWWALYERYQVGARHRDLEFATRTRNTDGL